MINENKFGDILPAQVFTQGCNDEFQVTIDADEDLSISIFKDWPSEIIPLLENNNEDHGHWVETQTPQTVMSVLERWRAKTELMDKSMLEIWRNKMNPELIELFLRIEWAFRLHEPFYNLEAWVADIRVDKSSNPVASLDKSEQGGELDAIALVAHKALPHFIIEVFTDPNRMSWSIIADLLTNARNSEVAEIRSQFDMIASIAAISGLSLQKVVFAVNVLNLVNPSSDLTEADAGDVVRNSISNWQNRGSVSPAGDINALIRFHNWTPAIIDENNFSGWGMRYDSVCAPSAQLFSHAQKNPEMIFNEIGQMMFIQVSDQLQEVDATSARGRFFLHALNQGWVRQELVDEVRAKRDTTFITWFNELQDMVSQKLILRFEDFISASQVGGKAMGIALARDIFGEALVPNIQVLPY